MSLLQVFHGNTSVPDHFTAVLVSGHHLLVGARNAVYKLDTRDMGLQQMLDWPPPESVRNLCLIKGKSEDSCHNYIKVAHLNNLGLRTFVLFHDLF